MSGASIRFSTMSKTATSLSAGVFPYFSTRRKNHWLSNKSITIHHPGILIFRLCHRQQAHSKRELQTGSWRRIHIAQVHSLDFRQDVIRQRLFPCRKVFRELLHAGGADKGAGGEPAALDEG